MYTLRLRLKSHKFYLNTIIQKIFMYVVLYIYIFIFTFTQRSQNEKVLGLKFSLLALFVKFANSRDEFSAFHLGKRSVGGENQQSCRLVSSTPPRWCPSLKKIKGRLPVAVQHGCPGEVLTQVLTFRWSTRALKPYATRAWLCGT